MKSQTNYRQKAFNNKDGNNNTIEII